MPLACQGALPPHRLYRGSPTHQAGRPPPLLPQVPDLHAFTALRLLELSYNEIRSLAPLAALLAPQLSQLYVAANKVTRIEGVSQLTGG